MENVVVTGGADSVGLVIAQAFLVRGHRVHVCDVNPDALASALAAHPQLTGTLANVGKENDVARVFEQARNNMGGDVSILVNNVGISGPRGALETLSAKAWQESFDVNVHGMFYCMREVIPAMKKARYGSIVNFSTGSTRTRLPMRSAYVASKFAVEGLTLNAARELGPFNVRCNAILPGAINNARMRNIIANKAAETGATPEQVAEQFLSFISMRSMIEPSEVADMVLFLASEQARKVTGELLAVSGNVEWED